MCWNEIVEYYAPLWRAVLGHRFLLGPFHRDYRFQLYVCVRVYERSRFGKARTMEVECQRRSFARSTTVTTSSALEAADGAIAQIET